MSFQRRHGQPAQVYQSKVETDRRGNKVVVHDAVGPIDVTAVFIPERSARAEVPGQRAINVVRMIVTNEIPDMNLWSRVRWNDRDWDVVTPPAYHHGTRHTRHYSVNLRERGVVE